MKFAIVLLTLFIACDALAQDFVAQCTEENIGGDEVLCQTNGIWGTCQFEDDAPMCGIAYCPLDALHHDSCVVAGYGGSCIPRCEVDFGTSCDDDGLELVCEVSDRDNFGDDALACASGGAAATAPSFLLLALLVWWRRR